MNSKLSAALIVCGTMCILATVGLSAFLIKQLSSLLGADDRIHDNHMLLVSVAAFPGVATFTIGVILLVFGLRRL